MNSKVILTCVHVIILLPTISKRAIAFWINCSFQVTSNIECIAMVYLQGDEGMNHCCQVIPAQKKAIFDNQQIASKSYRDLTLF